MSNQEIIAQAMVEAGSAGLLIVGSLVLVALAQPVSRAVNRLFNKWGF